jgi:RecJ-like exonuclease
MHDIMENQILFLEACKKIASKMCGRFLKSPLYIFSHFDPDGITSAAILAIALKRRKVPFHLRILKRLEFTLLEEISNSLPEDASVIFCDLGSGVIDAFLKWKQTIEIFILDHHSLEQECDFPENINLLNPHCFSIDGSNSISGSGVTYNVVKQIDPENKDLSPLAIIGALGDRQDQGEKSALIGLNRLIMKDAIDMNLLSDIVSIWFFDRTRDLYTILKRLNIDEFENEGNIGLFLEEIGIPSSTSEGRRAFYQLEEEEKKKLASELIIKYRIEPDQIYKHDYILTNEKISVLKDARVFANRLNACGRVGRYDISVALCLGDRGQALVELSNITKTYSKLIGFSLNWSLNGNNLQNLDAMYYIDGRESINENIIGPITSIISSMRKYRSKPVLGSALIDESKVKISVRRSQELENVFELDKILKRGVELLSLNTEVGGHSAAAGAIIAIQDANKYVNLINTLLGEVSENGN